MRQSFLEELKTTTPAGLGTASWPIQWAVLGLWILVVIGFGEMWVFKDLRSQLAKQRNELSDLDHSLRITQQSVEIAQAEQVKQDEILESLQAHFANLGPLRPASDWLAHANQLASGLGLEGVIDSSDKEPMNTLPWLDANTPNPHLQAITTQSFSADLTGHWSAVLAWLDAVMEDQQRGKVWLHQLQLTRAPNLSLPPEPLSLQLQVVLSNVGLPPDTTPSEAFIVDTNQQLSWENTLGEAPWGRGMHASDWWQVLPLSRLTLIGTGQMAGRHWAWVLDPRGELHRVFVNTEIARPVHRVVSIDANTVSLVDVMTEASLSWVVGQGK